MERRLGVIERLLVESYRRRSADAATFVSLLVKENVCQTRIAAFPVTKPAEETFRTPLLVLPTLGMYCFPMAEKGNGKSGLNSASRQRMFRQKGLPVLARSDVKQSVEWSHLYPSLKVLLLCCLQQKLRSVYLCC